MSSFVDENIMCYLQVVTYNGQDWGEDGKNTFGGYSDNYVVDNRCSPQLTTNKRAIKRAVKAVQSGAAKEDMYYVFLHELCWAKHRGAC